MAEHGVMGTGVLSHDSSVGVIQLNTHLYLVPMSRMSADKHLLPVF
jgi:hypothetical protein